MDAFGPELFAQLLARDNFTGMLEQRRQYLKRLFLELDLDAVPAELARTEIALEFSEAKSGNRVGMAFHRARPSGEPSIGLPVSQLTRHYGAGAGAGAAIDHAARAV